MKLETLLTLAGVVVLYKAITHPNARFWRWQLGTGEPLKTKAQTAQALVKLHDQRVTEASEQYYEVKNKAYASATNEAQRDVLHLLHNRFEKARSAKSVDAIVMLTHHIVLLKLNAAKVRNLTRAELNAEAFT